MIKKLLLWATLLFSTTAPCSTVASHTDYFSPTYLEARSRFRHKVQQLKTIHQDLQSGSLPVPSKIDADLTIDFLYLPAKGLKTHLLILTSGLHGVEAFAGNAIQLMFLEQLLPQIERENLGLLVVHTLNPFGHKYLRRVSENNVDLNRNFGTTPTLYSKINKGYRKVEPLLNPRHKVDLTSWDYYFSFVRMIFNIARYSMKPLRQAILQGQYEFPKGLYFGGHQAEPQQRLIEPLMSTQLNTYQKILALDLHTGYGERGVCHLFGPSQVSPQSARALATLFAGYQIHTGQDKDFYSVDGGFLAYLGQLTQRHAPTKLFIPMTLEFGTLNSQTLKGALRSISTMILENQGFQRGYDNPSDVIEVRQRLLKMYAPPDPVWRKAILQQSRELLPKVIRRFLLLDSM